MNYIKYSLFDNEYELYVNITKYASNNNIAVQLITKNGEPFANLTVNIMKLAEPLACIDTNNVARAEQLINKYNLGAPTGEVVGSGFCIYPIYLLNLYELEKYSKEPLQDIIERVSSISLYGKTYKNVLQLLKQQSK